MSIASINYASSVLGLSVRNINERLTNLSAQLSTGKLSQTYAGMGVNEGFAIAARAQLSNISAYTDTITSVNVNIGIENTALQSLVNSRNTVQNAAASTAQNINSNGQTMGQQTALSQLTSMLDVLNTQSGNRYLFSGTAVNTPSVASVSDILNGTTTLAGLKTVIAERQQADLGLTGMGRLVLTQPVPTSVQIAEDAAGSPFGLKLAAISSTLSGSTVTGPSGSPAAASVDLGATNPNDGEKVSFQFMLPDGSTEQIDLTASSATPLPSGSFAIGANSTITATNLNNALNSAIQKLANTSLVAASAVAASDNFFNIAGTATGTAVNNKAAVPAPITGATLLSGAAATDSIATDFAPGDTITVNGTQITFVAAGATGNQLNVTDSIQTLLSKIDSITGTSTPSTVHGGVITIHTDDAASLNVTSSNAAALAALGFPATVTAPTPPLRVGGVPLGSATTLVNGSANTVKWYTGNSGPGPARSTATARADDALTVQYGAQANETAIRSALQSVAVFAAFSTSPTGTNSGGQISALSYRVTLQLLEHSGQQNIEDIQTDLAMAQSMMKDASARQSQAKATLQSLVDQAELASPDQVAAEILALQTALQASYQTTSMLSQLTLVKFLA